MENKEYKYRFTIFTATYNRASLLLKLYKCIKNQTYNHDDFEWVIVSDGSTDNTPLVISDFIEEGFIHIKFINKDNGGKHSAWKVATDLFEGRYVVTADDDDPLPYNMLETYDKYWKELETQEQYKDFWEIKSRCQYEDGTLVGEKLPEPYFDSDYIEVTYILKKQAEMDGCRKVEVLRNEAAVPDKFAFQNMCSNYPEGIRWARAARKYKTRFVPDITRTYVVGHDSLCITPVGEKVPTKKLYNSLVGALETINEISDILWKYDKKQLIKTIFYLTRISIRLGVDSKKFINQSLVRYTYSLLYLPALLYNNIKK